MFALGTWAAVLNDRGPSSANFLWAALDLRREGNLATWFESVFMLMCGISFATISWSAALREQHRPAADACRFAAGACVFLSADEAAMLHEKLGAAIRESTHIFDATPLAGYDYEWLLLYAPVMLAAALVLFLLLRPLRYAVTDRILQGRADACLSAACLCVPLLLLLECGEFLYGLQGLGAAMLHAAEESVELLMLSMFFQFNIGVGHYVR